MRVSRAAATPEHSSARNAGARWRHPRRLLLVRSGRLARQTRHSRSSSGVGVCGRPADTPGRSRFSTTIWMLPWAGESSAVALNQEGRVTRASNDGAI
jgi:hypothetical protein